MLKAIAKEIELRQSELEHETIETIYFGGGTPSLLSTKELEVLISVVYNNYQVISKPEITLEANPDDLSPSKIEQLSKSPVNRLSIGVQSFSDAHLKQLNRAHASKDAHQSIQWAAKHFENITIDLIYGIPNMSFSQWHENLTSVFKYAVNHISAYALTVEPKTALATQIARGSYPKVKDELALQHYNILVEETAKQGFVHYEISNFGKPQFFSKHNTSYWLRKPYIGVGPSAHSYNGSQRSWNVAHNIKYIKAISNKVLPSTFETLTLRDQFNEYIMTRLRTIWGVSIKDIETDFGVAFKKHLLKLSETPIKNELLTLVKVSNDNEQILKTTPKGAFLVDGLAAHLFMI